MKGLSSLRVFLQHCLASSKSRSSRRKRRIQKTLARRFVSEPRDKEATHVHEVQVVPISEPRVVEAVETVEESCGNQSSTDDAEWTDSGEEDWEDTSTEEDSEEVNVEEGKATSNDEEEIHWSSDEFEGLESDDEREVEREKGFMLEKGKARKQKAPVSTSRMATRSQSTNASIVETMQEKKTRKMKEYLAKRRARMAGAVGAGGDAIGASSTSVTGGDAGAAGAAGAGLVSDAMSWKSLLGGCWTHRNVKFGEIAAENLLRLDPNDTAGYILMF
ncbi:hypothetical protein NE237_009808 [Protea cynaroides]|uniref:Uncharacterized protein n=1 Tax=Protea cynaroides TaxID=273540 RepID=A0A9Q0KY46_9MAGN|nr:hypothetical protein NE237_009808 [Protea cynaroides]